MYSQLTFDAILKRMLNRVSSKLDKREGSIMWDALAPASVEFQNAYVLIEAVLMEMFADTATRKFLIKHCADRGITPYPASYAIVEGKFTPETLEIPIGSRFSHEDLNYIVTEKIADGSYHLKCETIGSVANDVTGQLIPIDFIKGLETAHIVGIDVNGEDEESTESLRARYFASIKSEAFGGNEADYINKIMSFSDVGAVKVYGAWNGGGTVKCVILNSEYEIPSAYLVEYIQGKIDPSGLAYTIDGVIVKDADSSEDAESGEVINGASAGTGTGKGLAPIGHFVTIIGANEETVNLTFDLKYKSNVTWGNVETRVKEVINAYLHELNEEWAETDQIRVRISHLESRILTVDGILDIFGTTINGMSDNYAVDKDSIVKLGTINGNA